MNVVRVRHMGMHVLQRLMPVAVAVFTCRHGIVGVLVMPVVVAVGVFVLQRLVLVLVAMGLGQVQHHASQHQHAAQRHQPTG